MPFFTHRKLVEWIDDAGKALGFEVESEKRRATHEKIFQIDSMWFKDENLFAFLEAEKRWDMNHIIGHLACCADYANQEEVQPYFILVFLENEATHCGRLVKTWEWLRRMLPPTLQIRCLPIYIKRNEKRVGLHASTITKEAFTFAIQELIV